APARGESTHPVSSVIDQGKAMLVPAVDADWLRQIARSPEHLAFLEALDLGSLMSVPLMFGDRALGAITFCFERVSGREHDEADLALAQELAHRAAIAVRNAALYRRALEREGALREAKEHAESARVSAERAKEIAEQANRAKSEFLAVLSHELRTPLTPVLAGVQLLQQELEEAEAADAAGQE